MGRLWRVALLATLLVSVNADAQVIEFESGGLKYQALTKDGLTIMVAPLSAQVRDYTVVQVAIQNGGKTPYTIRPEDFLYRPEGGIEVACASRQDGRLLFD